MIMLQDVQDKDDSICGTPQLVSTMLATGQGQTQLEHRPQLQIGSYQSCRYIYICMMMMMNIVSSCMPNYMAYSFACKLADNARLLLGCGCVAGSGDIHDSSRIWHSSSLQLLPGILKTDRPPATTAGRGAVITFSTGRSYPTAGCSNSYPTFST